MKDRLVEAGYAAAWKVVRTLPAGATAPLFALGADLGTRRGGPGIRQLAANLRRVVGPDMSEEAFGALLRAAVRSYARYWHEAFRLPALSHEQRLHGFALGGGDLLAADVAAGRGAIVALPHAGNWDAAGAWVAANGWPITTVAERLQPERLYERFLAFRRGLGMEIVPLTGGERPAVDVLVDRLGRGAVVPLLADRDLSARGVEVEFFGAPARMPAGPALLALRTGAPLYTTAMWFTPERPEGRLTGPLALPGADEGGLAARVRILTQRMADGLARGVAEHPQDWHMLQRLWTDQGAAGDRARARSQTRGAGGARSGTRGPGAVAG